MYPNPEKPESGLVCSIGAAYVFDCPPRFAFQDNTGCVYKAQPGFVGPPGRNPVAVAVADEGAAGADAAGAMIPDGLYLPRRAG